MAKGWVIRRLGPDDAALVAASGHLFDDAPIPEETTAYLVGPDSLLWFAFVGEVAAGFVSGVLLRHPDKRPSLFVNELGVDEAFRRKGIATALMETAIREAREQGCEAVWVAAEGDDELAIAFYESLPNLSARTARVFEWAAD